MVKEDEQAPVDQPSPLLEELQRRVESVTVYVFPKLVQIFQSRIPVLYEDLAGQFTPQSAQVVLDKRKYIEL